jgi:ribulose-phosphate 3-epimerase
MVEVVPAILARTYEEVCDALARVEGDAHVVQIDVVDGSFAPSTTWPLRDDVHFPHIVSGAEGMPLWESFDFEFDLMVRDPKDMIDEFIAAGAARVVLHVGSDTTVAALATLQERRGSEYPIEVGLALHPDASIAALSDFANQFDYIQVMGIEHLGVQGQELAPQVYDLIRELRKAYPDKLIQLDGGVRVENVLALVHAGVNRLVAGSAVFGGDDPKEALAELERAANR